MSTILTFLNRYVEQFDVHNGYLTVREALRFSAKLRQEPEISLEEKYNYVEEVLEVCTLFLAHSIYAEQYFLDDGNVTFSRSFDW